MKKNRELWRLFTTFFKIGLFTIGGGLAMLPLIQKTVVEEKKWMTEAAMTDCIAVCQSLPGVLAINAATYIGKTRKGMRGAIAASLGVITPSFVIIILAVSFLSSMGENTYVTGAFTGIKAASCAMILYSAIRLGKKIIKGKFALAVAVISFVMIVFLKLLAIWVIAAAAAIGLIYAACGGSVK